MSDSPVEALLSQATFSPIYKASEAVIPLGQEDLLADMLGRGATLPSQCVFARGEVDRAMIRSTYACPNGELVFELRHPGKAPGHAIRTERFAILRPSGSVPTGLVEALVARVRSYENGFEWGSGGADSAWLTVREQQLDARLQALKVGGAKRVLLLNATMGLQFYPSIVDFFVHLQRAHGALHVTSASYFEQIHELRRGVVEKGLPVVSVADVMSWSVDDINRFDVVICVGPSEVMARLMTLEGLTAKLLYLDFGFNHQLIDWTEGSILRREASNPQRSAQHNLVIGYSCQPEPKVDLDLSTMFAMHLFRWQWFNYISIGFTYGDYYRSDRQIFDVALLGSSGRDYAEIDPRLFGALRFLFLGSVEGAPHIERLRSQLDITVVPRVDEATYARLLALCRCVVLPADPNVWNVFLSIRDTLASGVALVTSRHLGLARLERENVPAVFYDGSPGDLFAKVDELLRSDGRLKDIGEGAIAFAKQRLDIYGILETIVQEQLL